MLRYVMAESTRGLLAAYWVALLMGALALLSLCHWIREQVMFHKPVSP
jgi:hypothetical protein